MLMQDVLILLTWDHRCQCAIIITVVINETWTALKIGNKTLIPIIFNTSQFSARGFEAPWLLSDMF